MSTITFLDLAILAAVIAATGALWRHRPAVGPGARPGAVWSIGWPASFGLACLAAVAVVALLATQIPASALKGASALAASEGLAPIVFRTVLAIAVVVLCIALLHVIASARIALAGAESSAASLRSTLEERDAREPAATGMEEPQGDPRLSAYLEASEDWAWETDANGSLISTNDRGLELLGYRREQLLGMERSELCHPDELPDVNARLERHRSQKKGWHGWVLRERHQSGSYRYFESSAMPVLGDGGQLLGYCGMDRDITDRLLLEEALEDALATDVDCADSRKLTNALAHDERRRNDNFADIVGDSEPLVSCLELVQKAGPTALPVLILGETGTGKELIARATHQASARSQAGMVSLNCATLPPDLVEAELFGHEKGAFTGAVDKRRGMFELADGGTIFLDEIGELPLALQSKLLRVLDDGSFTRVGGTETIRVDVRLISATNVDLDLAVQSGRFRADLCFRINTVTIRLPPLRERRDDIPALARHFVAAHGPKLNKNFESISTGLLRLMQRRDWPGNIRELENFIERCMIASDGPILKTDDADVWWMRETDAAGKPSDSGYVNLATAVAEVERRHIQNVLDATHWVIDGANGAASMLGVPPSTLRYKMKRLGIVRG